MTATLNANHEPITGRFTKGNKAARKLRDRPEAVRRYRRALLEQCEPKDLQQIVSALVIEAKAGDVKAATLVFDRILGRSPDRPLQEVLLEQRAFRLPPLDRPQDLLEATRAVGNAVAGNTLDDRRARHMLTVIEQQRRNLETVSMQERLDTLEQLVKSRALSTEGERLRQAMHAKEITDESRQAITRLGADAEGGRGGAADAE